MTSEDSQDCGGEESGCSGVERTLLSEQTRVGGVVGKVEVGVGDKGCVLEFIGLPEDVFESATNEVRTLECY